MMAMAYHLSRSLETLCLLKEYQDSFEIEALVISKAKCLLLQEKELNDFYINNELVSCIATCDGYELEYQDYLFLIETNNDCICDYSINCIQ